MKNNLIKKFAFPTLVFVYDTVSLFLCYVIIKSLIFQFFTVKIGLTGIDIIGGVDIPTLIYKMSNVIGVVFPILFILLSVVTIFLLTVPIFKKQKNQKFNRLLCIFSVLTLIIFVFIPAQTYVIALYALTCKISLLKYSQILYIIISVANIIFLILPKRAGKNSESHN